MFGVVEWLHMAQDINLWHAIANTVMNFGFCKTRRISWPYDHTSIFSSSTLLHADSRLGYPESVMEKWESTSISNISNQSHFLLLLKNRNTGHITFQKKSEPIRYFKKSVGTIVFVNNSEAKQTTERGNLMSKQAMRDNTICIQL